MTRDRFDWRQALILCVAGAIIGGMFGTLIGMAINRIRGTYPQVNIIQQPATTEAKP